MATEDDKEPSTPIHSTGSYPVFRQTAEDLADKLDELRTVDATLMAGELRWYAETFASWSPTNRPSDGARTRIISEYMQVYRRVLEYLSKYRAKK